MNRDRFNPLYQDQVSYSNISQYLCNDSQISYYRQIQHKFQANQVRFQPSLCKESQLDQQKRMDYQGSENSNQSSDSPKEDSQLQIQNVQKKRKPSKTFKIKESKNKFYARNYRQKKKEKYKCLEEENRFLKSKIDDLTFRLKQTQIELNNLKHNSQPHRQSIFKSTRQSLLKQINEIMKKQDQSIERLVQLQKELKKISAFDSKHKMELLNYFMSELLQNLINDGAFYFADSLISQKGLWKLDSKQPCRQIDYEICELLGLSNFEGIKRYYIKYLILQQLIQKILKTYGKNYIRIISILSIKEILSNLSVSLYLKEKIDKIYKLEFQDL